MSDPKIAELRHDISDAEWQDIIREMRAKKGRAKPTREDQAAEQAYLNDRRA